VSFIGKLLSEDERISKKNLSYWIDYIYLFGVADLIPAYDQMDPIKFRNLDVNAFIFSILGLILYIVYVTLKCCCCSSKKVKSQ
jgi:hypothetical protein